MSSLNAGEKHILEQYLEMGGGYVLNFKDSSFGGIVFESVGIEIHDPKYSKSGTSKANKLRSFWRLESDHTVGTLLDAILKYIDDISYQLKPSSIELNDKVKAIVQRLLSGTPILEPLKEHATVRNANHLAELIRRMHQSVDTDPAVAIGTAKELIETCCKTILKERGKSLLGTLDIPTLTKETLKELKLVPEGVDESAKGSKVIKTLLHNLGTIGNGLAELRGLYGSGHGKDGHSVGLSPRHAKLAVGAAATLTNFLFETHKETSNTK